MTPNPVEPIADIVLSAEVPHTAVHRVPTERVKISRRVVTETRTITVEVRREEVHVDRIPMPVSTDRVDEGRSEPVGSGASPVLTWVLHEELPEVVNRVVAVERVQVFLDSVNDTETVTTDLRHEEINLTDERQPPT